MKNNTLAHHGIKGQKWGVIRTPEQLGHKPTDGKMTLMEERYRKPFQVKDTKTYWLQTKAGWRGESYGQSGHVPVDMKKLDDAIKEAEEWIKHANILENSLDDLERKITGGRLYTEERLDLVEDIDMVNGNLVYEYRKDVNEELARRGFDSKLYNKYSHVKARV